MPSMTSPYFLLPLQTCLNPSVGGWSTVTTASPQENSSSYTNPATGANGPEWFYRAFLSNPE